MHVRDAPGQSAGHVEVMRLKRIEFTAPAGALSSIPTTHSWLPAVRLRGRRKPRRLRRRNVKHLQAMKAIVLPLVLVVVCAWSPRAQTPTGPSATVLPGIEVFVADVPQALRGKRVGLITNHSGDRPRADAGHRPDRAAQGPEARRAARAGARHPRRRSRPARRSTTRPMPKTGVPDLLALQDRGPRTDAGDAEGRRRARLRPPGGRRPHLDVRLDDGAVDAGGGEEEDSVRRARPAESDRRRDRRRRAARSDSSSRSSGCIRSRRGTA